MKTEDVKKYLLTKISESDDPTHAYAWAQTYHEMASAELIESGAYSNHRASNIPSPAEREASAGAEASAL